MFTLGLLELASKEDPTVYDHLAIVFAFSILWAIVFYVGGLILGSLTYEKPWLRFGIERAYGRYWKGHLDGLGIEVKREDVVEWLMRRWPWAQMVVLQHSFSCLLCLPSVMGIGDEKLATPLAVLAILSEVGWELYDTIARLYIFYFYTSDKLKKVRDADLAASLWHHSGCMVLGLPVTLYLGDLKASHWLCFDMQLGATAFSLVEYSKFLDISKPNELRQFKAVNLFMFVLMVWTRLIHYVYVIAQILMAYYRGEAWTLLIVSIGSSTLFFMYNLRFVVMFCFKRYRKFADVSAFHEA